MRPWRVRVTAEGLNLERFLRRTAEHGVALEEVVRQGRRVKASAREEELPILREIAEKGGWSLTIGERQGLGHALETLRRRWLLIAAMALGLIAAGTASQVMWQVRLEGAGIYSADLTAYLQALDITPPRWRGDIDISHLRDQLEWRYPKVAWVEVGWRGMTLEIRLVEGVADGEPLTYQGAGDVVATRDGVVERIIAKAGTAVVLPGQLVKAGDVLIRGEERGADGTTHPVSARGVVMARVWEKASVRMALTETDTEYTGKTEELWTVSTPFFDLWRLPETRFDQCDVRIREVSMTGWGLPVVFRQVTRMECRTAVKKREISDVLPEIEQAVLRKLGKIIGNADSFIDKWVNWSIIEDEALFAEATGERLVDIAGRPQAECP